MFKAQLVKSAAGRDSWTVTGPAFLPVPHAENFLSYCSAVGRSPNTVETYARALAVFFRWLEGRGLDWRELTLGDAARFVEWLQRPSPDVIVIDARTPARLRGRMPSTVNKIVAAVTSFYGYHASNGVEVIDRITTWRHISRRRYKPLLHHVTKSKPTRHSALRVKQSERLPQILSREDVQALLDACNHLRDRFLIALLHETGLRIGQALGLRHGDMRTWEHRLIVRPRDDNANGARAKTRTDHVIEITPVLGELHSRYMFDEYGDLDSDYLFVNLWGGQRGRAMAYSNVVAIFRALQARTGIRARPHMLRHTHATELLRFGVQTEVVARRLTHSSTATLSVYEHLDQADLRAELEPFWAARATAVSGDAP